MVKFTTNDVIHKFRLVHGDVYSYDKTVYESMSKNVIITCKNHGDFLQRPDSHLRGRYCPICNSADKIQKAKDRFILNATTLHKGRYDYTHVNYINNSTKVKIGCSIHGYFLQTPNNHTNGQNCPDCVSEIFNSWHTHTTEDFVSRANAVHSGKYEYTHTEYKGSKFKLEIVCPIHGKFYQRAIDHLKGHGCNSCYDSRGERNVEDYLRHHKMKYIKEYIFNDCRNIKHLPFDFYLPEYNVAIEYQGKQHYTAVARYGGDKTLLAIQHRDNIKKKYCLDNNINFLEIHYKNIDCIPTLLNDYFEEIIKKGVDSGK